MIIKRILFRNFFFCYIRPSHCAAFKGNIDCLKRLIKYNADIWIKNKRDDYPIHEAITSISFSKHHNQINDFSQLRTGCFGRRK